MFSGNTKINARIEGSFHKNGSHKTVNAHNTFLIVINLRLTAVSEITSCSAM